MIVVRRGRSPARPLAARLRFAPGVHVRGASRLERSLAALARGSRALASPGGRVRRGHQSARVHRTGRAHGREVHAATHASRSARAGSPQSPPGDGNGAATSPGVHAQGAGLLRGARLRGHCTLARASAGASRSGKGATCAGFSEVQVPDPTGCLPLSTQAVAGAWRPTWPRVRGETFPGICICRRPRR